MVIAMMILALAVLGSSSIWMTARYINRYKTAMRTEVSVEILKVDLDSSPPSIELEFTIANAVSDPFEIDSVVYEVGLNGKYMTHGIIKGAFRVSRSLNATIDRVVVIPEERAFTLREAEEEGRWIWSVSGSLHVTTYMGETRIRYGSSIFFEPDG